MPLSLGGEGGRVEVRIREEGRWVAVEVADNGSGIDPEDLPHIFEALYRGRKTLGVSGSGMGRTIARQVILRHGGEIEVRSRPGVGTLVTVRLPVADVTKLQRPVTKP